MNPPKDKPADVIPFRRSYETPVAEEIAVGRKLHPSGPASPAPSAPAIKLDGVPKLLMLIGAGNVGKTTLTRWIVERMLEHDGHSLVATVAENPSLRDYFGEDVVHRPSRYEPSTVSRWLEDFLQFAADKKTSATVDFGGGDTSLAEVVASTPNFAEVRCAARDRAAGLA